MVEGLENTRRARLRRARRRVRRRCIVPVPAELMYYDRVPAVSRNRSKFHYVCQLSRLMKMRLKNN